MYLDACCINRLTDDQAQDRVRAEATAVEKVLHAARKGTATWVSSVVLRIEISRNPHDANREDAIALLSYAQEVVVPGRIEAARAKELQAFGFSAFDALHLACAEAAHVDIFLTTDDDILRRAQRLRGLLHLRVENPVSWSEETLP
jgi:predicted nucleic acid-binding protein